MQFFGANPGKKTKKNNAAGETAPRVELKKKAHCQSGPATEKNAVREARKMAYPIRVNEVRRVLQPVLGTRFVTETSLCDHVTELLRRHQPGKETPDALYRLLKERIFADLYELLGHQMLLQRDHGAPRRILLRLSLIHI